MPKSKSKSAPRKPVISGKSAVCTAPAIDMPEMHPSAKAERAKRSMSIGGRAASSAFFGQGSPNTVLGFMKTGQVVVEEAVAAPAPEPDQEAAQTVAVAGMGVLHT